jgi:DNA-3-methyladenine glycosylase II
VDPDDVLTKDPVMAGLIADHGGPLPLEPDSRGRPQDHYGALVRSIAGQQLSVGAARAIWNRLIDRYGGRTPTPQEILAEEPEELRAACGFSRAKVASLRSLAEHVLDGRLELDRLHALDDEKVIEELVAVKGIGVWTAQMFLMFTLHRPDVLPVGDLGVRNAAMRAYGLEAPPAPDELTAIAEAWRPQRTRASLYLWRSLDNAPK